MPNQVQELKDAKAKRFAEIYLYEHCGNITKSYAQLRQEFIGLDLDNSSGTSMKQAASRYFRYPEVQKAVQEERKVAAELYAIDKTEIVGNLKQIAYDEDNSNKDRLAALKQLTEIAGYATQNVNLQAKADIEVVIE